jgi:hypothetical protein
MRLLLRLVVIAVALVVAVLATYLAWPSESMIEPEPTGEIGPFGLLLLFKYGAYFSRMIVAAAVLIGSFAGVVLYGFRLVDLQINKNELESE